MSTHWLHDRIPGLCALHAGGNHAGVLSVLSLPRFERRLVRLGRSKVECFPLRGWFCEAAAGARAIVPLAAPPAPGWQNAGRTCRPGRGTEYLHPTGMLTSCPLATGIALRT
jgi:hypothetical protein